MTTTQSQSQSKAAPDVSRASLQAGLLQRKCACGSHTIAGSECSECEKNRSTLQRASRNSERETRNSGDVPSIVHEVLRSPGQPLDTATRAFFEPRFRHDFSRVRVHTDTRAAESAQAVNAFAYTVGQDVVFGAGQHAPTIDVGKHLLAHELTHVVQQASGQVGGSPLPGGIRIGDASDSFEHEADAVAHKMARSVGKDTLQPTPLNIPILQRQDRSGPARRHRRHNATPTLGHCRPVQDDLRPTAPWSTLQRGYQARCSRAAGDVAGQVGSAVGNILHGRMPRAPHLPDERSSVDCACAYGTPYQAALAALPVLVAAGPLARQLYLHFLGGSGTPMTIDVAGMIARSSSVRAKIRRSIGHHGMTGTTRLNQSDYNDREYQFAYGAIDCVQWLALPPARHSWRSDPTTQIRVSMLDYYEFHPGRLGISQCAHAACVELVARGEARNFWTRGEAVLNWDQLRH